MDHNTTGNTALLARRLPLAFVAVDAASAAAACTALAVQPAPAARSGARPALQLHDGDQQLLGTVPITFSAAAVAAAAAAAAGGGDEDSATTSPTPASKKRRRGGGGTSAPASLSLSQAELAAARDPCHPSMRALHGLLIAGEALVEVEEEEGQRAPPLAVEPFSDGSALVRALCRVRLLAPLWWRAPSTTTTTSTTDPSSASSWAAGEFPASARDRAAYALSPRADHVNALLVGLVLLARGQETTSNLPRLAELDDPDAAAGPFGASHPHGRSLREEVLAMARQPRCVGGQGRQDEVEQAWRRALAPGRPRGLACALYGYQRRCVSWMAWREQGGFLSGGGGGGGDAAAASSSSSSSPSSSPGLLGLGLLNPLWRAVLLPAFWEQFGEGQEPAPDDVRRAAELQERALASAAGAAGPSSSPSPPCILYHCAAFGLLSLRRPPPLASVLGGCLCDEVGVGKTVEVIALALLRPPPSVPSVPSLPPSPAPSPPQPLFGGTLVVCPPALLSQWHAEVRRHAPSLRVAVYEGLAYYRQQRELEQERLAARSGAAGGGTAAAAAATPQPPPQPPPPAIAFPRGTSQAERRRAKEAMAQWSYLVRGPPEAPRYDAEQEAREAAERVSLANADVVLTAFPVLNREADLDAEAASQRAPLRRAKRYAVPDSPLVAIRWWRVVVDEAQMVPNSANAAVARVCERLRAPHRWCVTGTPVTDAGIGDVHAMLRVLRVAPVGVAAAAAVVAGAATTTTDAHLAEAVFEAAVARPYREWAAAAASSGDADNHDHHHHQHDGGDGRRRLAALLRPLAWRHTRADANADHPLPSRAFAVARLRLSPAERSVYDHILARTVAASEAWAAATAAAAAASAAGPSSSAAAVGGAKRGRSATAASTVQRSLDLAAGELLQLRLACIHPQLTLYWRQLSAEVQGLGGGGDGEAGEEGGGGEEGNDGAAAGPSSSSAVVSIGMILRRLRDGAQLRLQAKERELCAALNALAARLTRRAEEVEEEQGAAAVAGPQAGKAKGKGSRGGAASSSPSDPIALRAEALSILQQSYAVGEHGIAALDKKAGGGGGGEKDDKDDNENEEPLGDIAGAEATWRAWQYQQLHTLGALSRAHEHAGRRAAEGDDSAAASLEAAAEARRSAERVTKALIEPAVAARDKASAAAASLKAAAEASERELRESWREAVMSGGGGGGEVAAALLRGGVPGTDLLDAAVAEATAAAEKAQEEASSGALASQEATTTTPTSSSLELRRRCAEAAKRARLAADDASSESGGTSADSWLTFCAAALEAARLAEEADRREQQEEEMRRRRAGASAAALALASASTTTTTVVLLGRRVREVAERLEAAANLARQAFEGEQARRLARSALDALAHGKRGFDLAVGSAGGSGATPATQLMPYDCPPERALLTRALFQHAAFGGTDNNGPATTTTTTASCEHDGRACALAARFAPDGLASAEALRRTLQQASRALQRRLPQWQTHGAAAQSLPQRSIDHGARASKLRAKLPRRRYDSYRAYLAAEAAEDVLSAARNAASAAFEGDGEAAAAAAMVAAAEAGEGQEEGGAGGRGGGANKKRKRAADASHATTTTTQTEAELRAHAESLAARCRELLSQRRFLRNQVLSAERQAAAVERAAAEARAAERRRREAAVRAAEARQQVEAAVVAAAAEAEEDEGDDDADDDQQNECPVCRSSSREQNEAVVFACGHFLCVTCAEALLGSTDAASSCCAVCRQPISRATSFRVAMRRTMATTRPNNAATNAAHQPGTAAAVAAAEAAAEAAEAAAAEAEAEAAAALLRGDPAAVAAEAGDPDAEGYVSGGGGGSEDEGDEEDGPRQQQQQQRQDDNPNDNPLPKAKSLLRVRVRGPHGAWLTKVCALVRRLVWLRQHRPDVKSLVFSQFPDALLIVSRALAANGIRHACIGVGAAVGGGSGGRRSAGRGRGRGRAGGGGRSAAVVGEAATTPTSPSTADAGAGAVGRSARLAVRSFAEDDDVRVMLLSLRAGGQGLTLTRASRVFLLEPSSDPSVDEQAVARVYRIGQERRVVVTRLLVEGTVEEGVAAMCGRKGGVGYGGFGGDDRSAAALPPGAAAAAALQDDDQQAAPAVRHEHLDAADVEGLLRAVGVAGGAGGAGAGGAGPSGE